MNEKKMTAPPAGALEACPFCGGAPRAVYGLLSEVHYVTCDNDDCKTNGPSADSEADAIAAWNRRTHGPALLAALRLREWRPIAEAPKDGPIIVSNGEAVGEARYHESAGGWWWAGYHPTDAADGYVWQPTCWMPLPAPPTADDLARILGEG